MQTINIKPHSIILTVGPSNCGKTYLVENYLIPQLREQTKEVVLNIQHVSSDNTRRELLGYNLCEGDLPHKYDNRMMPVSEQAFNLLKYKVEMLSTYPVNADVIIVDSTGLNEQFRKSIIDIARKNQYNSHVIAFDYPKRADYFRGIDNDDSLSKSIISGHLKRFKERTIKGITSKYESYNTITKIKSNDFDKLDFRFDDYERYLSHFLPKEEDGKKIDYIIVGDVHGCYDELIELLAKNGLYYDQKGNLINNPADTDEIKNIK